MFYSESLLAKTGPLARVWLAANLERKLTKQNILQSDIDGNVRDIIGTGQAPMALRLSGQLLLGVVRIYSKKAKYLLDDCSDALNKLKQQFRSGNVDLPANQLNANALTLADAVTDGDLFPSLPDPDDLFQDSTPYRGVGGGNLLDFDASQLLPETQSTPTPQRRLRPSVALEEEDLDLDLGLDEPSIEIGREARTALPDGPSVLEEDLNLDIGFDDTTVQDNTLQSTNARIADEDTVMDAAAELDLATSPRRGAEAQADDSFRLNATAIEEVDETAVQAQQRVKRRKVLRQDVETEIHNSQIKQQQEDRSAITRAPNFLPQDPFLLQLIEAQRNGTFVSSILGDGRMIGMAPELHGVCSIDIIRKVGDRKRKRDSGIADMETGSERNHASPQYDNPLQDDSTNLDEGYAGHPLDQDTLAVMNEDDVAAMANYDVDGPSTVGPAFDHTEAPLLHPAQSGPVSLGTKTAVAALRKHLAPGHDGIEPPTPSKRIHAEANFSELCLQSTTRRSDATKMFFELLVLGTKDAIKIEQEKGKGLDGEIRVRGKRGLWEGDWASLTTAVTTV